MTTNTKQNGDTVLWRKELDDVAFALGVAADQFRDHVKAIDSIVAAERDAGERERMRKAYAGLRGQMLGQAVNAQHWAQKLIGADRGLLLVEQTEVPDGR